jgi:RNA polymerase sigma-70 factor, ECF subfamily
MSAEVAALQEVAMRGLSPMERTAFVLRHMEDRSTEEIAVALNVTPNTAKQSVYRAVQKVRHRLTQLKVMA